MTEKRIRLTQAESGLAETTQAKLHKRIGKVVARQGTHLIQRDVTDSVPMDIAGRIALPPPDGSGLAVRPVRFLLQQNTETDATFYVTRPNGGTLGRPISIWSSFGVPRGELAGNFEALRIDLRAGFSDSEMHGLASQAWEPLDGLGKGNLSKGLLPDLQHFATACLIKLENVRAYPAVVPIPGPPRT